MNLRNISMKLDSNINFLGVCIKINLFFFEWDTGKQYKEWKVSFYTVRNDLTLLIEWKTKRMSNENVQLTKYKLILLNTYTNTHRHTHTYPREYIHFTFCLVEKTLRIPGSKRTGLFSTGSFVYLLTTP